MATQGDPFGHAQYTIRQKVFKLLGNAFHVYDPAGNVVGYSKLKAFKLKEDIRLYTGEDMSQELMTIQARSMIDFSAAYDVVDVQRRQRVGTLKRKGWSSLVRDAWLIQDASDREVGQVVEDSTLMAVVRRFVEAAAFFFPQKYHVEAGGRTVATFQQNFNPFVRKLHVTLLPEGAGVFDPRLALAAAILISAIEGRQQ